jgi:hypothetical protein
MKVVDWDAKKLCGSWKKHDIQFKSHFFILNFISNLKDLIERERNLEERKKVFTVKRSAWPIVHTLPSTVALEPTRTGEGVKKRMTSRDDETMEEGGRTSSSTGQQTTHPTHRRRREKAAGARGGGIEKELETHERERWEGVEEMWEKAWMRKREREGEKRKREKAFDRKRPRNIFPGSFMKEYPG